MGRGKGRDRANERGEAKDRRAGGERWWADFRWIEGRGRWGRRRRDEFSMPESATGEATSSWGWIGLFEWRDRHTHTDTQSKILIMKQSALYQLWITFHSVLFSTKTNHKNVEVIEMNYILYFFVLISLYWTKDEV